MSTALSHLAGGYAGGDVRLRAIAAIGTALLCPLPDLPCSLVVAWVCGQVAGRIE